MKLVDTEIKHIKYDKISKLYFALDETENFIDDGQREIEEAKRILEKYVRNLNGEV